MHIYIHFQKNTICSFSFKRANHGSIETYPLEKISINSWALATTNPSIVRVSLRDLSYKDRMVWTCIPQKSDASMPESFLHGYVAFTDSKFLEQSIYLCSKITVWKKIRRTKSINLHETSCSTNISKPKTQKDYFRNQSPVLCYVLN